MPEEPRASPSQAALPSLLLPGLEARATRLSGTCFCTFLAGRRRDGKVGTCLLELPCLGFVPSAAGARKACGEQGLPVRWGSQRDPSQPAGQQVVQNLARLTREAEQRWARLWPPSFRMCIVTLCFLGRDSGPAETLPPPRLLPLGGCVWSPGSSILPLGGASAIHRQGAGVLGIPKKSMSSLALVAPVAFFGGWFRAGLVGPVVLNTCRFCLPVSPCCLCGLGKRGCPEAPEEMIRRLCGRICPNDPLKNLQKLAPKVTSLARPLLRA